MNLDKIIPLVEKLIVLDTNIPHPEAVKKVAKKGNPPADPTEVRAVAHIQNGNPEPEQVVLVGERVSQEAMALYARLDEQGKQIEEQKAHIKEILYWAGKLGIPVREGVRALEVSDGSRTTYPYQEIAQHLTNLAFFLLRKFREEIAQDETALQLIREAGLFADEAGSQVVPAETFFDQFKKVSPQKNVKIKLVK